jgi:hypothetical protein
MNDVAQCCQNYVESYSSTPAFKLLLLSHLMALYASSLRSRLDW